MAIIQPKDLIEGDIFELLGLQNMSDEKKETLMAKMIEGIQSRVILRIDDLVGDDEREQFHQLLDRGDDAAIKQFLANKNINVPQLTAEEALLMKDKILQNAQALKE